MFGKIEEMYECSGIWEINSIYFFSDITKGISKEFWFSHIRDDLVMEKMMTHGVILLLLGIGILTISLYVLYISLLKWQNKLKETEDTEQSEGALEDRVDTEEKMPYFVSDYVESESKGDDSEERSQYDDEDVSEFNDMDKEYEDHISNNLNRAMISEPSSIYDE